MTDVTTGRGRALRWVGGLLVLALTGGATALGLVLPAADTAASGATEVEVPAGTTNLVCPGPLILPEESDAGGSAFRRVPVDPIERVGVLDTSGGSSATLTVVGGEAEQLSGGTLTARGIAGPSLLSAPAVDGEAARVVGTTSAVTTDGDLRGLAAGSCAGASSDVWLVGGSTELESTADLVLVNPGVTTAQVSLSVWGPAGAVDLATSSDVLVAPQSSRTVVLTGVAAEQRRIVVHAQASGGQISAYLQDSLLDGLTPRGTDLVTAGAAPATSQVVPGLMLQTAAVDDPDAAQLRLLAPGDEGATVSVSLIGPDGEVPLSGAEDLTLEPGVVTDLSLGGVPTGAYTAVVASDQPVVAGAMLAREGTAGDQDSVPRMDRAWAAATATGGGLAAQPPGARGRLLLTVLDADADAEAAAEPSAEPSATPTQGERPSGDEETETGPTVDLTVRAYGDRGLLAERTITVTVGTTDRIDVSAVDADATTVEVEAPDGVDLAWSMFAWTTAEDGQLISVISPVLDATTDRTVRVRPADRAGLD
ncbi:DUF5719 family protein [Cellulomonas sp. RIT-PI-Y]|uniref:DUF5719 family protein n=1 Tax=Cellulomonas sp. RIT-PI-Y TaxID=3035297 RepID=UPI0021DA1202|nr:DUF5719 family protein [Cellulomonas sp. RIT-PI-Y]